MIGNRSWSLSPKKINYWWALYDGALGAEENRSGSYDTKNVSVDDLSTANSLEGGLGIIVSSVCGVIDSQKRANC
jgi:hypothetical protein